MPFNGSGVYTAPAADFPVVTQTVISSTHFNNTINDIATALSTCLTKDGQQTATANINFGGFRATNVGITAIAGSVGTPAINVSDTGTGLYRSAASELAVTVAGTQRARFDGTGLIVTGVGTFSGATSTTTLTASTSVVTPTIQAPAAAGLVLGGNAISSWQIYDGINQALFPTSDNAFNIGRPSDRVANVFTPVVDSGTTGSLSLRTNNGTEQLRIVNGAAAVNVLQISGGPAAGNPPQIGVAGTDTNIGQDFWSKGSGGFRWVTNSFVDVQFQVLHTASATRNIIVTGSNGGNPTISTTAGSLAITPAVVIAGASLTVDTSVAVASVGSIRLPNIGSVIARNAANSGDVSMTQMQTINGAADIVVVGGGGGGLIAVARSGGAAPTTSDLATGRWTVWRDTGGATTKLYYNNSGALQSVALT